MEEQKVIICVNCKEKIEYDEGLKYCPYCGAPLGKQDYIDEGFGCIYGPEPTSDGKDYRMLIN